MSYSVAVLEKAGELTAKDIIRAKDVSNTISLDNVVSDKGEPKNIGRIKAFIKLQVHNDKSNSDKDYEKLVVINENGEMYSTGSESFENSFRNLWAEVENFDDFWELVVFKKPSKNYSGKGFLTCTIL